MRKFGPALCLTLRSGAASAAETKRSQDQAFPRPSVPTQRECLEMMGCIGTTKGKAMVGRLLDITATTVLAGELSLSSAIVAGDWVSSHDELGWNR